MKVSIYRIENWRGAGPYNYRLTELNKMHEEHRGNRPHPRDDGIAGLKRKEHCGFGSLEDLKWWFRGYLRALSLMGFNIAVYKVPLDRIRYGNRQLVFERGDLLPFEHLPVLQRGKIHK